MIQVISAPTSSIENITVDVHKATFCERWNKVIHGTPIPKEEETYSGRRVFHPIKIKTDRVLELGVKYNEEIDQEHYIIYNFIPFATDGKGGYDCEIDFFVMKRT